MKKTILLMTIATLLSTGCATITKGTSQTLVFKLDPKETTCVLVRGGTKELGEISYSNNALSVGKSKDDIIVKCEAPGHAAKTMRVVSEPYGGILWLTDLATGAYWEYPGTISITLDKETSLK